MAADRPASLRVGVNLLWSVPGGTGGSEEYLARQLAGLAAAAPDVDPVLFVPPAYPAAHPELSGLRQVVAPAGVERRPQRVLLESTWLRRQTRGLDVVHHGGGTMPLGTSGATVVTLHDLQWLRYPEYVRPIKLRYLRTSVPRSLREASVVAVPSEYVRTTVIDAYGLDPPRVVVVPHGFDPPGEPSEEADVRRRYGLGSRPYLVLPAVTHPHKNHRHVLELMANGPAGSRWRDDELALVLLGGRGLADDAVAAAIDRLGLTDRVVRPGRVPAADRDGLLAAAEALVFPSQYEGFGAPVLEAMALGTPVIASDEAALPEVVGEAGLALPLDLQAWGAALDEIATRRTELIAAGRARAATFTTARSGAALAVAYRQAAALAAVSPRRLVVLCPHFDPDTAPTGRVMSRIVGELTRRGHHVDVVTALPWYRDHAVDHEWTGRWSRTEHTPWGSIRRLHPFPGSDRRNLVRRAAGFAGFTALATWAGLRAGGWGRRADAVIAMSPPLTMGPAGRLAAWAHRAPLVFNVQDVFPDAAVATGAITDRRVIAAAAALERASYRLADAVTVLSDDLRDNVIAKVPGRAERVHTVPNFVDTERIVPGERLTPYRAELAIGEEPVVLYAGNIGFSQSLDLVLAAARAMPEATFLINGEGSAKAGLLAAAADLPNVRFGSFVPDDRLVELLATGDVHVVPLRRGLGSVSVPSKTYSILAAGRPIVAAVDAGTEVPRLLAASGAGVAVPPDDASAFVAAVAGLVRDPAAAAAMGRRGREWVLGAASPGAVALAYERLIASLGHRPGRRGSGRAHR